jgi:hypothetical protein
MKEPTKQTGPRVLKQPDPLTEPVEAMLATLVKELLAPRYDADYEGMSNVTIIMAIKLLQERGYRVPYATLFFKDINAVGKPAPVPEPEQQEEEVGQ